MSFGWHHEPLEVRGCELVIDTPVSRILHGEHPAKVDQHLIEHVGCGIAALWDIELVGSIVIGLHLISTEHDAVGEA